MMEKTARIAVISFLAAGLLLSGCATNKSGTLARSGNYGNRSDRKLITPDGKKVEENLNPAEEYEHLGDINLQRGDVTTAFVNYAKALQVEPGRPSASYKKGRLFLVKGMTSEARAEFEKIIKKDPKNAPALEGMGRAYLLDNKNETAVEYFTKALAVDEQAWETHVLIGIAYDRLTNYPLAADHYGTAASLKPDAGMIYNNLGVSCYLAGDYSRARDAFLNAIVRGEEGSRVFNNLGVTYAKLGDYQAAREAFARAGSAAAAQNNLGYLYLLDGKNHEAAIAFEKAIELNPSFYGKAHDNLRSAQEAIGVGQ